MKRSLAVCALLVCTSCVPWTVRPIGDTADAAGEQKRFSAPEYVDSIWQSRVVPAVLSSAVDLRSLINDSGAQRPHATVRGEARIASVDTSTQTGTAGLDLLPADGRVDALLQIGPVIRGSSLRDAVGFIQFGQFVNQLDYADVSNELNARVIRDILPTARALAVKGRIVTFHGTFSAGDGRVPHIVPVKIDEVPERK